MTHAKLGYEVLSALLVSQFKSSAANHHHSQSVLQPVASAAQVGGGTTRLSPE